MIVERRTYRTKPMRDQQVADFLKEVWELIEFPNTHRIYLPTVGPFNLVYHDLEFKDLDEYERFWDAFFARPEMPDWTEKWTELVEADGSSELLRPVE